MSSAITDQEEGKEAFLSKNSSHEVTRIVSITPFIQITYSSHLFHLYSNYICLIFSYLHICSISLLLVVKNDHFTNVNSDINSR